MRARGRGCGVGARGGTGARTAVRHANGGRRAGRAALTPVSAAGRPEGRYSSASAVPWRAVRVTPTATVTAATSPAAGTAADPA